MIISSWIFSTDETAKFRNGKKAVELAVDLAERLELYQAGRPYRQMRVIKNEHKNHE